MPRKILHLDLDAFYCAVEENHQPHLRGQPFAVGGRPEQRGVVSSCSYAARRVGVRSAMPMSQALRLCPDLRIVSPHFDQYHAASGQVMDILHDLSPFVEQISIDEAFLDVTMLPGEAEVIARTLQRRIRDQLCLPCSLGVATNKLVAKIATNQGKARAGKNAPPNAILVVVPGEEAAFLAPLPVDELWGVGPKTAAQFVRLGIQTIGDLARCPETDLVKRFGKLGAELAQRSQGLDNRPVEPEQETKSISKEITYARDTADDSTLRRTLRHLSDGVGHRLRKDGLRGTTLKLKLRWSDFTTLSRQMTLEQPTDHDETIYQGILTLFESVWTPGTPVRLLGVGMSGFSTGSHQLSLWDDPQVEVEQDRLESALDGLRERFGEDIIRRGSDLMGHEE